MQKISFSFWSLVLKSLQTYLNGLLKNCSENQLQLLQQSQLIAQSQKIVYVTGC